MLTRRQLVAQVAATLFASDPDGYGHPFPESAVDDAWRLVNAVYAYTRTADGTYAIPDDEDDEDVVYDHSENDE